MSQINSQTPYKLLQIETNGTKRDATVDDVIKIVEDLTRIH